MSEELSLLVYCSPSLCIGGSDYTRLQPDQFHLWDCPDWIKTRLLPFLVPENPRKISLRVRLCHLLNIPYL